MKILKDKVSDQAEQILNEAKTLMSIDHPNVIKIHNVQSI
jgi:serine/threonine protein kinase